MERDSHSLALAAPEKESQARGPIPLSELPLYTPCTVSRICASHALTRRLCALGVRPGCQVCLLRRAPLGDPLELAVGDTFLAIRSQEAAQIMVEL